MTLLAICIGLIAIAILYFGRTEPLLLVIGIVILVIAVILLVRNVGDDTEALNKQLLALLVPG